MGIAASLPRWLGASNMTSEAGQDEWTASDCVESGLAHIPTKYIMNPSWATAAHALEHDGRTARPTGCPATQQQRHPPKPCGQQLGVVA